jgi:hypothetical protein
VFVHLLLVPALLAGLLSSAASAQTTAPQTRAEALRQQRAEKDRQKTPNEPDRLHRAFTYIEGRGLFVVARDGFHPKIGSLGSGSGFALGVGFRDRDLLKHHGVLELWTAGSVRKYWGVEARATFPRLAGGRVMADAVVSLREAPRVRFFGLGPDSRRQDLTEFSIRTPEVAARAGVRVLPALLAGGGIGVLSPRIASGTTDFVRSSGFIEVDYRTPLNARRGGWYRLDVSQFNDRDGGAQSFRRTDLDVRQYLGFLADRRVLALRGWLSTSDAADGSRGVPFYLMPTLGGNDTLRGFRSYRFRGPHAMLLQAEYRWELWSGLDAALFYDAGKVAMQRADLDFKRLEDDYGFGFRFNTNTGVIMRVDAAFGSKDGKHLQIVFGGVF